MRAKLLLPREKSKPSPHWIICIVEFMSVPIKQAMEFHMTNIEKNPIPQMEMEIEKT
jgi:hypothetical protein